MQGSGHSRCPEKPLQGGCHLKWLKILLKVVNDFSIEFLKRFTFNVEIKVDVTKILFIVVFALYADKISAPLVRLLLALLK